MKILHTSDWHVGKVLNGRDRYDEHAAVLGSIVRIARAEDVDLVLVAGDLFDSAAPSAKAQGLVMRTLLALSADARHVVAIAGNHDSPGLLDAVYQPEPRQGGLHVLGTPKRPSRGGMLTFRARSGQAVNIAALPFLSHRHAARAAEALPREIAEHAVDYPSQMAAMVRVLTQGFTPEAVNVIMTHATLLGGQRGGGERDTHTSPGYELPPAIFPPSAHYAALGHLHQQQEIPGPCPIFYSGSPLAVDFADIQNVSCALIISAEPGSRVSPTAVPVTGGRPLQTLHGTLDEVIAAGEQAGDAFLRVVLAEPGREGLGDLVRGKLPNALEVVLDDAHRSQSRSRSTRGAPRTGRSPMSMFGEYLAEQNIVDPRLNEMFAELLDEVAGTKARDDHEVPGQEDRPAGSDALPDDVTRPVETDTAETSASEASTANDPELLGEDDDGWEDVDGAGPPAADPAAASALPWKDAEADDPPAVPSALPGEDHETGDPWAVASAVPWEDPSAADPPAVPPDHPDGGDTAAGATTAAPTPGEA